MIWTNNGERKNISVIFSRVLPTEPLKQPIAIDHYRRTSNRSIVPTIVTKVWFEHL